MTALLPGAGEGRRRGLRAARRRAAQDRARRRRARGAALARAARGGGGGRPMLRLHTLRFADELVDPDTLDHPALRRKPDARVRKMAGQLFDGLSAKFQPGRHRDTYRDRVLDLVERKAKGEEIDRRDRGAHRSPRPPPSCWPTPEAEPDVAIEGLMARARSLWSGWLSLRPGRRARLARLRGARPVRSDFHQIRAKTSRARGRRRRRRHEGGRTPGQASADFGSDPKASSSAMATATLRRRGARLRSARAKTRTIDGRPKSVAVRADGRPDPVRSPPSR